MKTIKSIYLLLLSAFVVGALASCSGGSDDGGSDAAAPHTDAYFTVQVAVAGNAEGVSRASTGPAGGEDGDGRELAEQKEYKVNNVCVFLYESSTGLADADAVISQAFYFEKPKELSGDTKYDRVYQFEKQKCLPVVVSKPYHVVVIANAGNVTSTYKDKKLSELRDAHLKAFNGTDNDFVMTSEKDATTALSTSGGNATGDGSEANPLTVSVDVERLAARIDIDPGDGVFTASASSTEIGTYAFDAKDASKNVVGGFVLESILPYNKLTSGEYCIKRVADSKTAAAPVYLGDETTVSTTDKAAKNYVVDPWTSTKAASSTPSGLSYNIRKLNETGWATATGYLTTKPVKDATNKHFFILDYVMENTTFDNSTEYATGLVFKGKFYQATDWDAANHKPNTGATGTAKYYTYVIRHSDPLGTGSVSAPMYYGIVRNNIYRIKIEGVLGEQEGLKLTLNVVPWARYEHGEVIY